MNYSPTPSSSLLWNYYFSQIMLPTVTVWFYDKVHEMYEIPCLIFFHMIGFPHLIAHSSVFYSRTHFFHPSYAGPKQREAMAIEIWALERNHTSLIPLPAVWEPVGWKCVYEVKYHLDGTIERYKACLVAKDYTKREARLSQSFYFHGKASDCINTHSGNLSTTGLYINLMFIMHYFMGISINKFIWRLLRICKIEGDQSLQIN